MIRSRLCICLLMIVWMCLGSYPNGSATEIGPEFNLDVQEFRLDNGMLFLVVERPIAPQVACRLAIRAGSALDNAGQSGTAHLLEHMMFKGTKNFGTLDYQKDQELQDRIEAAYQVILAEEKKREPDRALIEQKKAEMDRLRLEVQKILVPRAFSAQLGKNGAIDINAFTNKDQTMYKASVPSDMLEQWFSIISEQLFEPSWRELYVEKEVVQREWAYRYANSPTRSAFLDLNAAAYQAHPYRHPTIGWPSDMIWYNTTAAQNFHRAYYTPTNAVCVLVGDLTIEQARVLAERYFNRYPAGDRAPDELLPEPTQQGPRQNVRYLKGARSPVIRIGYHAARMGTADFYALDALIMVLSYGRGARLVQNITNKGLGHDAWAGNPDNRYAGMFLLGGSPNEPEGIAGNDELDFEQKQKLYFEACRDYERLLIAEVEKLKIEPVEERELTRIKKLNQREFLDALRNNDELAESLARLEVRVGWKYLTTYLERIATVTPDDITRVVNKYIKDSNRTSVYIIPGDGPDESPVDYEENRAVTRAEAFKIGRPDSFENHSDYPTPKGWKHPLSFERVPNRITYPQARISHIKGATVFYLQDPELPLIDVSILVKAGSIDLPDSKIGLTDLLNRSIIRCGTETASPEELARRLDENALQLTFYSGEEATEIQLSLMKEDWEKGLAILEDILLHSRFDTELLDVIKQQIRTSLERQGENAQAAAMREATIAHFKGHAYGRDPLRAIENLSGINPAELQSFLRTYCVPGNMVVGVAGDIDITTVERGLNKLFALLPGTSTAERTVHSPSVTPPVLALIDKPGQVQAQIIFMLDTVKRTHPDFWKISLLTSVFGGSDSYLLNRLRSDLGLVYATYAYQASMCQAGYLTGYIGCQADQTHQALTETALIMKRMHQSIPEADLELKRHDLLNSFVFKVDTPRDLVNTYARYQLRLEPINTLDLIQEAYLTCTADTLEELARTYLIPEKMQIVVVVDKTTPVKSSDGQAITLEQDLHKLAEELGLPFELIPWR
ncbi:insulinase family protein [bacterium]|nr:insulinase family protein [bacterium]